VEKDVGSVAEFIEPDTVDTEKAKRVVAKLRSIISKVIVLFLQLFY
jgi:hypothetical protein